MAALALTTSIPLRDPRRRIRWLRAPSLPLAKRPRRQKRPGRTGRDAEVSDPREIGNRLESQLPTFLRTIRAGNIEITNNIFSIKTLEAWEEITFYQVAKFWLSLSVIKNFYNWQYTKIQKRNSNQDKSILEVRQSCHDSRIVLTSYTIGWFYIDLFKLKSQRNYNSPIILRDNVLRVWPDGR